MDMNNPNSPGSPPHLQRRGCRLGVVGSSSNSHHHHQRRKHSGSVRNITSKDELEPMGPMPGYLTRRKPTVTTEGFPLSNDISQTFTLPLEEDDYAGVGGNTDDMSTSTATMLSSSSHVAPSCSYSASGGGRSESESMVSLIDW